MYHQTYQHNKRETRRVYISVILFSDKVREKGEICENTTVFNEHMYLISNFTRPGVLVKIKRLIIEMLRTIYAPRKPLIVWFSTLYKSNASLSLYLQHFSLTLNNKFLDVLYLCFSKSIINIKSNHMYFWTDIFYIYHVFWAQKSSRFSFCIIS